MWTPNEGGADLTDERFSAFDVGSHIPTEAYGGQSMPPPIPPMWNFTGRLADMIEGPYKTTRSFMLATLSHTKAVMRANAVELTAAAAHYKEREAQAEGRFNRFGGVSRPW